MGIFTEAHAMLFDVETTRLSCAEQRLRAKYCINRLCFKSIPPVMKDDKYGH